MTPIQTPGFFVIPHYQAKFIFLKKEHICQNPFVPFLFPMGTIKIAPLGLGDWV
jgi:hypothetical protein